MNIFWMKDKDGDEFKIGKHSGKDAPFYFYSRDSEGSVAVHCSIHQAEEMIEKLQAAIVKIKAEMKTADAKKLLDEAVEAVGADEVKRLLVGMGG